VLTKRTLDDVANNPRAKKWYSNRTTQPAKTPPAKAPRPAAVELKRPDKVLFPADGYTKADLALYYDAVARWMVPYLKDRPLSLERFPNGISQPSFFEKNVPRGAPPWLRTELVSGGERHSDVRYIVCDDRETLAYLANLAAITLHVWTSRLVHLEAPDYVFFDLDPGDRCPLRRTVSVALELRSLLAEIGLKSLVKTSGGSGLHVLVPLKPVYDYAIVRAFGELIARRLAEVLPDDITLVRATARRPADLVYFDFVQIGHGKTMVAPYTVRARDGAPVSMPIAWSVVEKMRASRAPNVVKLFQTWTIATVPSLLRRNGDAWAGAFARPQSLERAVKTSRSKWAPRE
jgi:bifunctional non-homologous end joining protein LigD